MYLRAGDFLCLRGRIALPLTGTWVADLAIDPGTSDAPLPGFGSQVAVSLGENGFSLQGTVRRVNNAFDTVFARVVGGGGGLYKQVPAKAWQAATFGTILSNLLEKVGEKLSTLTPGSITNISLPFWTTVSGTAFEALSALILTARAITGTVVNWRVLADGTIFVGEESWPESKMTSFDLMSWQPDQLAVTIFALDPNILPGQVWQSGKISNVSHQIEPEAIRSKIWFLNADTDA